MKPLVRHDADCCRVLVSARVLLYRPRVVHLPASDCETFNGSWHQRSDQ